MNFRLSNSYKRDLSSSTFSFTCTIKFGIILLLARREKNIIDVPLWKSFTDRDCSILYSVERYQNYFPKNIQRYDLAAELLWNLILTPPLFYQWYRVLRWFRSFFKFVFIWVFFPLIILCRTAAGGTLTGFWDFVMMFGTGFKLCMSFMRFVVFFIISSAKWNMFFYLLQRIWILTMKKFNPLLPLILFCRKGKQ